jgi:hypothetical protein
VKRRNAQIQFIALSLLAASGEPVNEFRIWKAGLNPDRNGPPTLFDEKAAQTVLESQKQHGVRAMMDLEHLSLDDEAPNYDPDARAWLRFEVRRDESGGPELWAVVEEWTPDGARRVKDGTQRYASPAFFFDKERRPTRILNVALCAMPATDHASPLLAASERTPRNMLTLKALVEAAAMVRKLNAARVPAGTIVKTLAEGDSAGEIAGVNIADLAELCGVTEDPGQDPAGFIAALLAKLDEVTGRLTGTKAPPKTPDSPDTTMPADDVAAARELMHLEGTSSLATASTKYVLYRDAYLRNEQTQAALRAERKQLEDNERAELCAKLLKAKLEDEETIKDVATLSIERLRERVKRKLGEKALEDSVPNAGKKKLDPARTETLKVNGHAVELDERELKICAELKCDPAVFAARKYPNGRTA